MVIDMTDNKVEIGIIAHRTTVDGYPKRITAITVEKDYFENKIMKKAKCYRNQKLKIKESD